MNTNLFMAVVLLTMPPECEDSPPPQQNWPQVSKSVQQLAIQWEIMDPREKNYVFSLYENYNCDIRMLRTRYVDLKDVPMVWESNRLPSREVCTEYIRFNRSYRNYVEDRMNLELDRRHLFGEVISEVDTLYQFWDAARDAKCEFYYITVRRQALRKVKDFIGEENYLSMTLPPNVPLWRFNELK